MESSIKRCEPTILKLVNTYNTLCGELQSMIQLNKAPPGAIPPTPIPSKGVFQLDIDSDIWQDIGLEGCYPDPPRWLADEDVRKGIRLMLEIDHCNEEERRLSRERSVLQEWFSVEWLKVQTSLENAGEKKSPIADTISQQLDECYKYHLKTHKDKLLAVYINWEAKVRHIPCAWDPSRSWGPTAEDIAGCLTVMQNPCVAAAGHPVDKSLDDYNTDWEDVGSESDDGLLMAIEEMELGEEYHIEDTNQEGFTEDEDWLGEIGNGYLPSSPVQLPLKRRRC